MQIGVSQKDTSLQKDCRLSVLCIPKNSKVLLVGDNMSVLIREIMMKRPPMIYQYRLLLNAEQAMSIKTLMSPVTSFNFIYRSVTARPGMTLFLSQHPFSRELTTYLNPYPILCGEDSQFDRALHNVD